MIAFLQPHIPHYRQEFFEGITKEFNCDLFCYQDEKITIADSFSVASNKKRAISSIEKFGFLIYNPFAFRNYDTLVLMLHFGHLTSWFLLLTKMFHKKKIILWGQGISVKRYLKEEAKPSFLLKLMIYFSDGVWFYTEKELEQWKKIFPQKKMISLNNTISGVDKITDFKNSMSKEDLKNKYNIYQEKTFIFCARFNNSYRRVDLLLSIIDLLDTDKYAFIIVGDGKFKPDFSIYSNVYDFGAVYDDYLKNNLFTIADLYIQPGWVGLSVVEAMAYGKPILTFKRTEEVLQCVEYHYIKNNENGFNFETLYSFTKTVDSLSDDQIKIMGSNAREYVIKNLKMDNMVASACNLLKDLSC